MQSEGKSLGATPPNRRRAAAVRASRDAVQERQSQPRAAHSRVQSDSKSCAPRAARVRLRSTSRNDVRGRKSKQRATPLA